jgi:hypothetical protein
MSLIDGPYTFHYDVSDQIPNSTYRFELMQNGLSDIFATFLT